MAKRRYRKGLRFSRCLSGAPRARKPSRRGRGARRSHARRHACGLRCVLAEGAATVSEALAAVEAAAEIDAAILDVNLGGEKVFPVADILVSRGVPIVFSTAYGPADLADRYPQARIIHKPYRAEALAELLIDIAHNPRA